MTKTFNPTLYRLKQERKRREQEAMKPAKALQLKISGILRRNKVKKAHWSGSSMVRGWGSWTGEGYELRRLNSCIEIDVAGWKDEQMSFNFLTKIKELLISNGIDVKEESFNNRRFLEIEVKQ